MENSINGSQRRASFDGDLEQGFELETKGSDAPGRVSRVKVMPHPQMPSSNASTIAGELHTTIAPLASNQVVGNSAQDASLLNHQFFTTKATFQLMADYVHDSDIDALSRVRPDFKAMLDEPRNTNRTVVLSGAGPLAAWVAQHEDLQLLQNAQAEIGRAHIAAHLNSQPYWSRSAVAHTVIEAAEMPSRRDRLAGELTGLQSSHASASRMTQRFEFLRSLSAFGLAIALVSDDIQGSATSKEATIWKLTLCTYLALVALLESCLPCSDNGSPCNPKPLHASNSIKDAQSRGLMWLGELVLASMVVSSVKEASGASGSNRLPLAQLALTLLDLIPQGWTTWRGSRVMQNERSIAQIDQALSSPPNSYVMDIPAEGGTVRRLQLDLVEPPDLPDLPESKGVFGARRGTDFDFMFNAHLTAREPNFVPHLVQPLVQPPAQLPVPGLPPD